MKRAYKLQEFVAHTSTVNCLKVGRKSAGVLVTGGEDKKVNVWAIGKSTAVLVSFFHALRYRLVEKRLSHMVDGQTHAAELVWTPESNRVRLF